MSRLVIMGTFHIVHSHSVIVIYVFLGRVLAFVVLCVCCIFLTYLVFDSQ